MGLVSPETSCINENEARLEFCPKNGKTPSSRTKPYNVVSFYSTYHHGAYYRRRCSLHYSSSWHADYSRGVTKILDLTQRGTRHLWNLVLHKQEEGLRAHKTTSWRAVFECLHCTKEDALMGDLSPFYFKEFILYYYYCFFHCKPERHFL